MKNLEPQYNNLKTASKLQGINVALKFSRLLLGELI